MHPHQRKYAANEIPIFPSDLRRIPLSGFELPGLPAAHRGQAQLLDGSALLECKLHLCLRLKCPANAAFELAHEAELQHL